MAKCIQAINSEIIVLRDPGLKRRCAENRKHLMELDSGKLFLHHRFEAGFYFGQQELSSLHGGWENPLCQLRGHFLGHWLSAAAMVVAATKDAELKAKADTIVHELAKCQTANDGEWCASIPEKLYICQYFPSDACIEIAGKKVVVTQRTDLMNGNELMTGSVTGSQTINDQATLYENSPDLMRNHLSIACESETSFTVRVRVPWWHRGEINVYLNGEKHQVLQQDGFFVVQKAWSRDELCFEFKKMLSVSPLPDQPDTVAFMRPISA